MPLVPHQLMRAGRPHEPELQGTRPLSEAMPVLLSSVQIPETRQRPLDPEATQRLREDIRRHGLLQPIGVRAGDGTRGGPFTLVFGYHRFVAFSQLAHEGMTLPNIPSVIYPADTPDWQIELAEVSENLIRKELSAAERAAHTGLYLALVKKYGRVASAKSVGNRSRSRHNDVMPGPTTTATKAAADALGVNTQTVHNRIARIGKVTGQKLSAERTDADILAAAAREALAKAHETEAAKRAKISRASTAGRERAKVSKAAETDRPESYGPLLATLDLWESQHGIATVQAVVQLWWQKRHPPGRVVFNREHGAKRA